MIFESLLVITDCCCPVPDKRFCSGLLLLCINDHAPLCSVCVCVRVCVCVSACPINVIAYTMTITVGYN